MTAPEIAAFTPPSSSVAGMAGLLADALAPLVAGRPRYLLADFPAQTNVGDSAIWTGEAALLQRLHGRGPVLVTHPRLPLVQTRMRLRPDDILYIHGGGNFGDLWVSHQLHREALMAAFPDHRIIQLPQSLHFRDPAAVERCKRAIGGHRDFHLLVRDRDSADFARRHFDCPVILTPDAAFCTDLEGLRPTVRPAGAVTLLRADHEQRPDIKAGHDLFRQAGWPIRDWERPTPAQHRTERIELALHGLGGFLPLADLRRRRFLAMARRRVARGLAQLGRGRVVVTDRLHGHILASLLGRPTVVLDNSYRKIGNFIATWGTVSPVHLARNTAEALEVAQAFLEAEAEDAA